MEVGGPRLKRRVWEDLALGVSGGCLKAASGEMANRLPGSIVQV